MLSKILRDEQKDAVEPLSWRRAGGPAPPPKPSAPVLHRSEGGHFKTESALQQEINEQRARFAQLEAVAEQRVREAREAGLREGDANGRAQATAQVTAQVQPVLDKLAQSIREIGELRPRLRHEAETDVVKLALAIAKKILHRELAADPDSLSALIRFTVEKIRSHELLRVRIHPQHYPSVQKTLAQIGVPAQVEVLADPKLALGGVVVETTRGEFDASVDTQLREIACGLTDRLTHGAR